MDIQVTSVRLSDKEFTQLSSFIYDEVGIKMPPVKRFMLESRLQRRLKDLNIPNFKQYIEFVFDKKNLGELVNMIDVVTTNKTDFFREPAHYDILTNIVLPTMSPNQLRNLKIWSAGCSSGEEPYTLSIVLHEAMKRGLLQDFSIMASDISTQMLEKAAKAIYPAQRVEGVPLDIKKRYFLKSNDPEHKFVCLMPHVRSKVSFKRINFMDQAYPIPHNFDIIFCRNVIIYFDRPTQEQVISKLCGKIIQGGFLFLGHSESITSMDLPIQSIKPTVFKKI